MEAEARAIARAPWIPYVAPMVVFAFVSTLEAKAGAAYPVAYAVKVLAVTATLVACRSTWKDIRPNARVVLPAVLVGLAVLVEWIAVGLFVPHPRMGSRVGFNPFEGIPDPTLRWAFIALRLCGLSLMVPVMEELFWRSFLLRVLSEPRWASLPVGTFSQSAFWITAVAFGSVHPEWLAAVICGVAYGALLWRTRSLFACIVAHAVTNLGLGVYVLLTGSWQLW